MSDPVADALKGLEATTPGSSAHAAAIEAVYAAADAQRAAPSDTAVTAGMFRIAQPAPTPVAPEPEPVRFDLPVEFAGHEREIQQAQVLAQRAGYDGLPMILTMLGNTPIHERTPTAADAVMREAMAARTMAALTQRYGPGAEEVADAAVAATKALGLTNLVTTLGQDNHVEIIDRLGRGWLKRSRREGA